MFVSSLINDLAKTHVIHILGTQRQGNIAGHVSFKSEYGVSHFEQAVYDHILFLNSEEDMSPGEDTEGTLGSPVA